jgi:hypothetical protein
MRTCNRCFRSEPEVTFSKKTLRCRPCSKEIWEENKRLEGDDPLKVRRDSKANKRYGQDALAFYVEEFKTQGGVCKICSRPEWKMRNGRIMNLCIDHCHKTGVLRGLLCHQCNSAIGFLNDDPVLVDKAAAYLRAVQCIEPFVSPLEQPSTTLPAAPAPI